MVSWPTKTATDEGENVPNLERLVRVCVRSVRVPVKTKVLRHGPLAPKL